MRQSALSCPTGINLRDVALNPAKDEFNTLLNYAYGILYSKVEKACIIAGLEPLVKSYLEMWDVKGNDFYGKRGDLWGKRTGFNGE